MKICLMRHGETDWSEIGRLQGREDIPLNEAGIRQSRVAAEVLAGGHWRAVIASPLQRAAATARIIADRLGLEEITEEAAFVERDYGAASGLTEAQRMARFPDKQYDGMENREALQKRMMDALRRYAETYREDDIIIVSHGAAINAVLATLSGNVIGSGKTRLKTAGMSLLDYRDGQFSIDYVNRSAEELDAI